MPVLGERNKQEGVRVRFRVRFQVVKVPIFGGLPVDIPTNKVTRLEALLRGLSLFEYGSEGSKYGRGGCPSTALLLT